MTRKISYSIQDHQISTLDGSIQMKHTDCRKKNLKSIAFWSRTCIVKYATVTKYQIKRELVFTRPEALLHFVHNPVEGGLAEKARKCELLTN